MKKYFNTRWILLAFILPFIFTSCEKGEEVRDEKPESFEELLVNPSFKFKSTTKVNASFTVEPANQDELQHIVKIYTDKPSQGGRLLTKGITKNYEYNVDLTIPSRVDKLFVENRNAEGLYEVVEIPVTGQSISHTFNTLKLIAPDYPIEKTVIADPGCEECEESVSGNHNNLTLDGADYCVLEGDNLTVSNQLKFKNGATLVICGSANISKFTITGNDASKLYVSSGGTLSTSGHLNINSKLDLFVFGIHNISGNVNTKNPYKFYNYGTMNIAGSVNNGTNELRNEGTMNISGHFNANNNVGFKNYGSMDITGNLNINGNSKAYNYCSLYVGGNLMLNKTMENHSYIEVANSLTVNGSGLLSMHNGALVSTKDLMLNATIKGEGNSFSKIDISNTTTLNGGAAVQGKMDICDENGIETNNGSIANEVVYCEVTIPSTSCNPGSGGNGSGDPEDTDDDGVPDVDDDYPEDPERAFNNYYPNKHDFGTFAFEDLWPSKGDYDFNDLVLDFHYKIVTNADNLIVDIIAKTHVKAAGANMNNGFGIAFPVDPSNCGGVSGYVHAENNLDINPKGYENGHTDNTVAIFYDAVNTIYGSSLFNTIPNGNFEETDTITVTTYFNNPQLAMGQEPYNPFIYANQQRGKEIHLIDNAPTDLMNMEHFNQSHDDSDENSDRWYVTENNLPWGVEIPSSFDYPIENADILDAHLKFADWAESSGTVYTDWYLDEPNYRNDDNIYSREE
ncbi:MAG: LruC domain-containing protein [Bacteroidales bacterium]|nr:LruC domain-containing protein [Bacteroidales bacterium]MCF8333464.1 LruC domain-containing protein [Bacteroidales bacterium]